MTMRVLAATAMLLILTPAAVTAKPPREAAASAKIDEAAQQRQLVAAQQSIKAGRAAEAMAPIDAVLAAYEAAYRDEKRTIYGARSMTETLYYLTLAAGTKTDAIALSDQWGTALYLKGFTLIELGQRDAAEPFYARAIALSPMNAQYLGEYAEWYKAKQDWPRAYELFERALAATEFSPDDTKTYEQRRALRGMGFVRIEQGRLDDAEALFGRVLAIDANDAGAKGELDYIRQQRARMTTPKT